MCRSATLHQAKEYHHMKSFELKAHAQQIWHIHGEIILLTLLWSGLSDRGDTFPESIFSLQEHEECIFKIL